MQLPKLTKLETHRPADQVQMGSHFDEGPQRHPLQRYRMTTPKRVQVDAMAMIRGNHGQASQSAFGRFGLLDDGQAAPAGEVEQARGHGHILTLSRGSRNQRASERCSRMISALKSMSACSGIFVP